MINATLVLQCISLLLLFLAAIGFPKLEQPSRIDLGWLGMFFWLLSILVH